MYNDGKQRGSKSHLRRWNQRMFAIFLDKWLKKVRWLSHFLTFSLNQSATLYDNDNPIYSSITTLLSPPYYECNDSVLSRKYLNLTPVSVNYSSTRTLVTDGDKSNAAVHIPFVRPCSSLYCTLTPTCSPHLSPGLLISSIICQGYLEDRKQDISRENVMPTSPFRAAAVLSDPIHFIFFWMFSFSLPRWKMSAGLFCGESFLMQAATVAVTGGWMRTVTVD